MLSTWKHVFFFLATYHLLSIVIREFLTIYKICRLLVTNLHSTCTGGHTYFTRVLECKVKSLTELVLVSVSRKKIKMADSHVFHREKLCFYYTKNRSLLDYTLKQFTDLSLINTIWKWRHSEDTLHCPNKTFMLFYTKKGFQFSRTVVTLHVATRARQHQRKNS